MRAWTETIELADLEFQIIRQPYLCVINWYKFYCILINKYLYISKSVNISLDYYFRRTKYIVILKLLETTENLSSSMNYNNCNNTTTKNSRNNDSKIPNSKNTYLAPQQWDILSTTSDSITNSDNGRLINVIPSISIEDQLREMRLQKDAQFNGLRNIRDYTRKTKSWKKNLILTHQIIVY